MLGRDQAAAFRLQVVVWRRRRRYTVLANSTEAMEFALTVPWIRGLMTPGSQTAPGVFLFAGRFAARAKDWRIVAFNTDCDFWSRRNAIAVRHSRPRAGRNGWHVPVGHAADQSHGMLSAWADRTDHAEPHDDFAGLACGDHRRLFWRLHHVFELRLGDGEDAGRRRMAPGNRLCRGQCCDRAFIVSGRDSAGELFLVLAVCGGLSRRADGIREI